MLWANENTSDLLLNNNQLFFIFIPFTFIFYTLALCGMISNTENILFSVIYIELAQLVIGFSFIYTGQFFLLVEGQIFALLLLGVAGADATIGLVLALLIFKCQNKNKIAVLNLLKG